jgi:hypothetical protein
MFELRSLASAIKNPPKSAQPGGRHMDLELLGFDYADVAAVALAFSLVISLACGLMWGHPR